MGYLELEDLDILIIAWRDDLEYRAALSIDMQKKGEEENIRKNRQRLIECSTVYVALRELRKEFKEVIEDE